MLRFIDISKYYTTKENEKVYALRDISFTLPEKGFYSFIGRSGSGKSTLLNILGGLDRPDFGKFLINGEDTSDYNSKEWDYYRGEKVGFIFQEFNLIEELNVEENIALSLVINDYQDEEIKSKIKKILEVVELSNYENRRVNELSGGEKQRIAIARALVKNPTIILADEPTGNLDKESSLIILKILKEISKESLVVLVTHYNEAMKFSDYIFELITGELVEQEINVSSTKIENKINHSHKLNLPFRYIKKIALQNIFYNNFKLFFTLILFVMSLMLVFITFSINNFNYGKIFFDTFKSYNVNEINFAYSRDCTVCLNKNERMLNDIKTLQDKYNNIDIFEVYKQKILLSQFVGNYERPKDRLFTDNSKIQNLIIYPKLISKDILYGHQSTSNKEILITDYVAYMLLRYSVYEVQNIQQLIGKDVIFSIQDNKYYFKISGIINTDCEDYMDSQKEYTDEEIDNFYIQYFTNYSSIYFSKENLDYMNNSSNTIHIEFYIENHLPFFNMIKLSKSVDSSTVIYGNTPNYQNEVMITLSKIFEYENITFDDFQTNEDLYINKWINKNILLLPGYSVDSPMESGYKIVGIINDINSNSTSNIMKNSLIVTDSYFNQYYSYYSKTKLIQGKIIINYSKEKIMVNLLNDINKFNYQHASIISMELNQVQQDLTMLNDVIFYITLFSLLFAILLLYTFLSNLIESKKIQIGILRSLGIPALDCSKIFIFAILLIIIFVNMVTISILSVIMRLINNEFSEIYNVNFRLFYFNNNILIILLLSCIIAIIASFIPLKKIIKMKPIDAIRNK